MLGSAWHASELGRDLGLDSRAALLRSAQIQLPAYVDSSTARFEGTWIENRGKVLTVS